MKNYEMSIFLAGEKVNIYIQEGFFQHNVPNTILHKHRYVEIHLCIQGTLSYLIGEEHLQLKEGELLIIPQNTFHKCYFSEIESEYLAFQIDKNFTVPRIFTSTPGIFSELQSEIKLAKIQGTWGRVPAYVTQICSAFLPDQKTKLRPVQDRSFIIHEFFSHNYADDPSLKDLAQELNLSLKQTERLMIKYIGNTFKQELSRTRIEAAKHLFATEDISLTDISEMVGYHSYSGFWKAFRKKDFIEKQNAENP